MASVYRLIGRLSLSEGIPESAMRMEMETAASGHDLNNLWSGILTLRRECTPANSLVLGFWPPDL